MINPTRNLAQRLKNTTVAAFALLSGVSPVAVAAVGGLGVVLATEGCGGGGGGSSNSGPTDYAPQVEGFANKFPNLFELAYQQHLSNSIPAGSTATAAPLIAKLTYSPTPLTGIQDGLYSSGDNLITATNTDYGTFTTPLNVPKLAAAIQAAQTALGVQGVGDATFKVQVANVSSLTSGQQAIVNNLAAGFSGDNGKLSSAIISNPTAAGIAVAAAITGSQITAPTLTPVQQLAADIAAKNWTQLAADMNKVATGTAIGSGFVTDPSTAANANTAGFYTDTNGLTYYYENDNGTVNYAGLIVTSVNGTPTVTTIREGSFDAAGNITVDPTFAQKINKLAGNLGASITVVPASTTAISAKFQTVISAFNQNGGYGDLETSLPAMVAALNALGFADLDITGKIGLDGDTKTDWPCRVIADSTGKSKDILIRTTATGNPNGNFDGIVLNFAATPEPTLKVEAYTYSPAGMVTPSTTADSWATEITGNSPTKAVTLPFGLGGGKGNRAVAPARLHIIGLGL